MAASIYVNMGDDATGECLEKDHPNWIEAIGCTGVHDNRRHVRWRVAGKTFEVKIGIAGLC